MEFNKNAGANTVSFILTLLVWAAWIIAGLVAIVGVYAALQSGLARDGIIYYVIAGIFYFIGKGIGMYHNSILLDNQNKDIEDVNKQFITIIGEDEYAKVEELELRVNDLTSEVQSMINQYEEAGVINEEAADAIIQAKTRTKDDIDNLYNYMLLSGLKRKVSLLNIYLGCSVSALGKAAELYNDGKTAATIKNYYLSEITKNIENDFMQAFAAAYLAKKIDEHMINEMRKNPNQQTFETKSLEDDINKLSAKWNKNPNKDLLISDLFNLI